jgi:hypothetical protein
LSQDFEYIGEIENGKPNGQGQTFFPDGEDG